MLKMKQLPIDDASDDQIKEYTEAMGVDTEGATSRAAVLALLQSVHDKPFILVPDVPESVQSVVAEQIQAVAAPAQQRLEGGMGESDPIYRVKIGQTAYPGGRDPVPVAVNGRTAVIQRNMTVDLPARYYFALQDAIRVEIQQADVTKKEDAFEVEYTNYPLQVLAAPTAAELDDWHARVDGVVNPA